MLHAQGCKTHRALALNEHRTTTQAIDGMQHPVAECQCSWKQMQTKHEDGRMLYNSALRHDMPVRHHEQKATDLGAGTVSRKQWVKHAHMRGDDTCSSPASKTPLLLTGLLERRLERH